MPVTYEAWLGRPARAFIRQQPKAARDKLWRLIRLLEVDPHVDGRFKVPVPLRGSTVTEVVYDDPEFWIYYHLADNAFVAIDAISRAWFDPGWTPPTDPQLRL